MEKSKSNRAAERIFPARMGAGSRLSGCGMLALAAFIWGTAFVAQSMGMEYLGPCTFNAVRSFIGGIVLLPVIFIASRLQNREGRITEKVFTPAFWRKNNTLLRSGVLCGFLLGGGSLLQQAGIRFTSAGKAGFLTALYIVMVPVLGMFFGRRPGFQVWAGVILALAGVWNLSVSGDFTIALGDTLVLCSALFFSFHILAVDRVSEKVEGIKLSCVQFFTAGILSAVAAAIFETPRFQEILAAWGPLLYTGVLSSGVAYTLQILGQKRVEPTAAALILSLESVFAALAGWVVLHEPLSHREILGCVLVFAAVILAQLPNRKPDFKEKS